MHKTRVLLNNKLVGFVKNTSPFGQKINVRHSTELLIQERCPEIAIPNECSSFTAVLDFYFHRGCDVVYNTLVNDVKSEYNGNIVESKQRIDDILNLIRPYKHIFETIFPVKLDSGRFELIHGFRIQHSMHKKPCIGGIRICEAASKDVVAALAGLTTYICAASHVPFGGAKAAIQINPSKHSQNELERIIKGFALELFRKGFAGPCFDILCPGQNCGPREMTWIADMYSTTIGYNDMHSTACVTGKSQKQNGFNGFQRIAAHGLYIALKKIFEEKYFTGVHNICPRIHGKTFILQGLGCFGGYLMDLLCRAGAKCIGIQDGSTFVFNPHGIHPHELQIVLERRSTISEFPGSIPLTMEDIKHEECDILVLTSIERSITASDAAKLKAKVVVEGVNFGITPHGYNTLLERSILVIPDILLNSSRLVVSYLEWLKNINHVSYGKTFFKYEKDVNLGLLESVQVSLERRFGRSGGPILMNASASFNKHMTTVKEEDVIIAGVEQSVEHTIASALNTLRRYSLGTDIRTATYANAIEDMFHVYNEQM